MSAKRVKRLFVRITGVTVLGGLTLGQGGWGQYSY